MKRKTKLLILECTSEYEEKMSEGPLLKELMRILGFEKRTRFKVIRSKRNLIGILGEMEKPYLHISAHGDFDHKKGTSIRISKRAKIYPYEVNDLWVDKRGSAIPKLFVLSACQMGHTC